MSNTSTSSARAKKKIVPELRFPEFVNDGEWVEKKFEGITDKIGDGIHTTPKYDESGKYFFINGNNLIDGKIYVDEKTNRVSNAEFEKHKKDLNENTVLLSINGTIGNVAFYNSESVLLGKSACYINPSKKLNNVFLFYSLQSEKINKYFISELTGSTIKNLSLKSIRETILNLPTDKEQQKIASCLSSLDDLITSHTDRLQALKDHKKGLMQNLFPTNSITNEELRITNVPNYRFPEFEKDGEWAKMKLGEIGAPLMCKRIFKDQTTTNSENAIPFYKIGTFGREADSYISIDIYNEFKNKYSFPNKGDILISASGTIGRLVVYDGSPAYFQDSNIVWLGNDEELVLNIFLFYCYSIIKWQTSDGGVIKRLYNSDLKNIQFFFPKGKKEQQKIASCLSALDDLMTDQSDKIEQLQQHKKGLMQGLFPKSITN